MTLRTPSLILASASPRRSELLRQIGVAHEVRAVDVDESRRPGESPRDLVCRLALDKALEGHRLYGGEAAVLGADTVVVLDAEVFGKPRDEADAMRMLGRLGGRMHKVMTAVALAPAESEAAVGRALCITRVTMRAVTLREAADYWASGEPRDKAGSYAIQGLAAMFIERIEGSYSGVMGLPLYETAQLLQAQGLAGGAK
jgi:septum formation protein